MSRDIDPELPTGPNNNGLGGPNVPIPPHYPTPSKARPPAITGRVKTTAGELSPMSDTWAKANAVPILTKSVSSIVLGGDKRVSVPVAGIQYARPTMVYGAIPGFTWKQEGGPEVKTWCLVLADDARKYTIEDADAMAEIMQRGLTPAFRVGKIIVRDEAWYDNAKDLPDYSTVPIVNLSEEVSRRDVRILILEDAVKQVKHSASAGWEAARLADDRHAESVEGIHRDWRVILREMHTIYIVIIIVLLVVICLLLPGCHTWLAGS